MAMTPTVTERIELDLRLAASALDWLNELEQDWANEPIHNRLTWEMEWRNEAGRLTVLFKAYRAGAMSPEQKARFHGLQRRPSAALAIAERLGLALPRIPARDTH